MILNGLKKLRTGKNLDKIIVSHEGLSTLNQKQWGILSKTLLPNIDTEVIIVFRHWSEFLISRWSTNCLRRDGQSFHKYAKLLTEEQESRIEMNHSLCIKNPLSVGFNSISCIDYESNIMREESILPVLCRRMDIKFENDKGGSVRQQKAKSKKDRASAHAKQC